MLAYLTKEQEAATKTHIPWEELDSGIRGIVWRLNQVEGIATVQSCGGHIRPNDDGTFRITEANVVCRVTKERFEELLELAPECGVEDIKLRYFDSGWFWIKLSWEPSEYSPAWKLTRKLLGEEEGNADRGD